MRIIAIQNAEIIEIKATSLQTLSTHITEGYLWISVSRDKLADQLDEIQNIFQDLTGNRIVDLHTSDLSNVFIPSQYDYTAQYDVLTFRQLLKRTATKAEDAETATKSLRPVTRSVILERVETTPVGFIIADKILLSVHPVQWPVREAFLSRLLSTEPPSHSLLASHMPSCPADLMLRIVNLMVDGFLELRRNLSRSLDHWQNKLLNSKNRFYHWEALLNARRTLHYLQDICEDQRSALQDWIESLKTWSEAALIVPDKTHELLNVRSRDVLEHIERVAQHIDRLEKNAEVAIQIHFSIQGNRTNDIMRVLTALTAIFLPLNLIAGIFGMNFEAMPFIHHEHGFLWAAGTMSFIAISLSIYFWQKRYLSKPD